MPEFSTIIIALVFMVIATSVFIGLTDELFDDDLKVYDDFIIQKVTALRSPANTNFMKSVTVIGNSVGYFLLLPILSLFFIIRKSWRTSLEITIVLLLSSGLNVVLKQLVNRPRPPEIGRLVFAQFSSFPSGHAMSAITFYGFIVYLCFILIKKAWLKYLIVSICFLMVVLIGLSRIYLGVHFPSDILAGYAAGSAWLALCILVLNLVTLGKLKLEDNADSSA